MKYLRESMLGIFDLSDLPLYARVDLIYPYHYLESIYKCSHIERFLYATVDLGDFSLPSRIDLGDFPLLSRIDCRLFAYSRVISNIFVYS